MKKQYINRIANILNQPTLSVIMILFMMMLGGSVKAASDPVVAKWDFETASNLYPKQTIQKTTAQLTANSGEGLVMDINATTGKFDIQITSGKERVQMNKGTFIHVPVVSTNDIVEIKVQNSGTQLAKCFSFGGVTINTDDTSSKHVEKHKATESEVKQGYVEIKVEDYDGFKGNSYLFYVQVTQYPPVYQEKELYSTNFQEDWEAQAAKVPAITVNKKTTDGQDLIFTFNNTAITPDGYKSDKFNYTIDWMTTGYIMANTEKNSVEANYGYVETSELKSVTKVYFVQGTTGGAGKRGWGLEAIDSKGNITNLYDNFCQTTKGEEITLENLDLKNVKLRFYNKENTQNAYMMALKIYGNVEVKEDVNVTYYDTDGTTILGTETVNANNPLKFKEGINDLVTVPSGYAFRGWFDGTGTSALKVNEGAELSIDLFLYAKVTPIETTENYSEYTYDLTKNNFYQEDHELITFNGASWHDSKHGWSFNSNGTMKLQVAKNAHIDLELCQYSKDATITVTDESGKEWGSFSALAAKDGDVFSIDYKGSVPTTLTFSIPKGTYIHSLNLKNYTPIYVTFKLTDRITGTTPDKILCDPENHTAKMPNNELFYREGWSFTGWSDGTTIYEADKEYAFEQDVTLTANMVSNAEDWADTNKEIDVTWPFDHKYAPAIYLESTKTANTMSITKSISVNGNKHDATLIIDVTNGGKINNTDARTNALNNDADGAQVNTKTTFRIPAAYGMTITVHASLKEDNANNYTTTHFGLGANDSQISITDANKYTLENKDATISSDGKTISFTYLGDAKEIILTATKAGTTNDWGFFKDITATYRVLPSVEYEKILTNPDATTFPNEKIENVGTVTISLKDPNASPHNNTGKRYKVGDVVIIEAKASYGYDITKITNNEVESTSSTFEYTVGTEAAKIQVQYTRKEMHKVIAKTSNKELGTISMTPKYENFYQETVTTDEKVIQVESWFAAGTEVKVSSDAAIDYILDYWADNNDQKLSESNPYTFKMEGTDITLTSHYTLGNMGSVIFEIPEGVANGADRADACMGATSMTPDPLRNVRSFTIPTSYTLYKSDDAGIGRTLDHWTEKDTQANSYEPGHSYSFRTANETLTLIPVFRDNPTTYQSRLSSSLLRFDFATTPRSFDDPTTNERRTVCGQDVSIGNNVKTFWTAQTYVEILENGKELSHKRDAAIYCDTGSDGYIRNADLDDWCAIGPGTTLWVPSGVGSPIYMLTYAKITTTTIDGVVPTLDEARTAEERLKLGTDKAFVYTYTTQKTDLRVPIVIGDDYSYYQWIESTILPANLVNLHTSVDDEVHGAVTNVESATGNYEVKELEDGGHAFHQGDRVRVSFERKFGYEFDQIVDLDQHDAEGNYLTIVKMGNDGNVDITGLTNATFNKIEPTEEEIAEGKRTRYEIEFDIKTHRNLQILFKEKKTYYITYNAGQFASGTPPESNWVEEGDPFTIPRNTTLYYEGNTLHHWIDDAQEVYEIGKSYPAPAENLRLFPVFEVNKFNILDLDADATATWYLAKDDGAPTINYEGTAGILITQLTNNKGESIDMRVRLDGTGKGAKFNNSDAGRPERIQINPASFIEFPSTPNCSVTWVATSAISNIIIGGQAVSGNKDNNKQATVVCSGESSIQKIEFTETTYSRYFTITYKSQTATKATIESLTCEGTMLTAEQIQEQMGRDGHVTFTISPWKNDEKMPTVSGTATEGGTVTTTTATLTTKKCIATVRTAAGIIVETYPIEFEFATPEDGNDPKYVSIDVNGQTSTATTNVFENVARSGVIKVTFSRTMKGSTFHLTTPAEIESTSTMGKTLTFKYWDLPAGATIDLDINPESELFKDVFTDIYGKRCMQDLKLTLHVAPNADNYHHHNFDFIVGEDGTIDEAIEAANNNTKTDGHRYFIFVPDGEYELNGNEPISMGEITVDEKAVLRPDMNGQNNHMTIISKPNVSLIGQSKEGTILHNHPIVEGIGYTATIHIGKDAKDFYAEDLTLENRFDYWECMSHPRPDDKSQMARAAAFWDQGNRSIMKNVALKSWQDTYYSSNANTDYRGYFENCDLAGVVDWLCGNGDIWYEKCNIILRDRTGNNIAATSTEVGQEWGYVFNNCSIMTETDNPTQFKGNDWSLGRPWQKSPACTYLNTKMYTLPRNYGWNKMNSDMILRFHEYRSMDEDGNLLSLGTRSLAACAPAPGSEDCILNADQATRYTIRNVMGGPDAFEPNELCKQIDAESAIRGQDENHVIWNDNLELDDDELLWDLDNRALCYFIFKLENGKWKYVTNTTENRVSLLSYGSGYYCVRAANQRGGLGAATESIRYILQDPYELTIKQTGDLTEDGKPYGWSTICLPFNAKVPEEVTVYAATAHGTTSETEKVTDFMLTLTPVKVIDSEKGYVVYGPAGLHYFSPTSRSCDQATILTGNPTESTISATNKNGYVLANKTWGLGFYKFTGTTYAPYKAWLPQGMVSDNVQDAMAMGTRAIRFVMRDNSTTGLHLPHQADDDDNDAIYNLSGQKVQSTTAPGIYISRDRGKFIKK